MSLDQWDLYLKIIGTIVVLVGAITGGIKYFREQEKTRALRKQELDWKKAEFVFQMAQAFDKDEIYQQAVRMIDFGTGFPENSTLERILTVDLKRLTDEEKQCRYAIDHFLDFFDILFHMIYVIKVMTPKELECFTWYIRRIGDCEPLKQYAESHGYEDTLTLYRHFQGLFQTPREQDLYPK